jgi:hypothetical protein
MNIATQCDCCKEPIEGKAYQDAACDHPVCEECARNLHGAIPLLNKHGMTNLYLGACPDNGPEGLKKP